jgi:type I restriction enzyme S subunit
LLTLADRVQQNLIVGARKAERITQSVLSRAFAGELVETEADLAHREGREYEPAAALLERLVAKQQIENRKAKPKRRKTTPKRTKASK